MGSSVKLGTICGIEIGIHYSFFFILVLIVWSMAAIVLPQISPSWAPETYWVASFSASLLLFASIIAHEMGHSLVAQRLGLTVKSIVLFVLGGVSNLSGDAERPQDELKIAIVGPLTSLGLAVLFGVVWLALGHISQPIGVVLLYLTFMNAVIAVFNLVPGFPLDGGRIFWSLLWWRLGNVRQATRLASWVGQGIAYLLIIVGLVPVFGTDLPYFGGGIMLGFWTIFTGAFLLMASRSSYRQVAFQEALRGIRASQLMAPVPLTVQPTLTLQDLLASFVLPRNPDAVPVVQDGRLVGLINVQCLRRVRPNRFSTTLVGDVMRPRSEIQALGPEDDLGKVVHDEEDATTMIVVAEDRPLGVLPRASLLRFCQMQEAGMRVA